MSEESNAAFIVYSTDKDAVTIVGVFSTHQKAFECCEKVEKEGNPNVWMIARTMDKYSRPHVIPKGD